MPRHGLSIESQLPPIYISGNYFDAGQGGSTRSTIAGVATRLTVYPFVPNLDVEVNLLALDVTTAVALATARACIYDSDGTNSTPGTSLYQTAELDCSTTGIKSEAFSFTFKAGHIYWIGVHHSSTATLRGIPITDLRQIGVFSTTSGGVYTAYRRDVAYGTDSPDPFGTPILNNSIVPQIRFRIA